MCRRDHCPGGPGQARTLYQPASAKYAFMNWIHRLLSTAESEPPARKQAVALQVLHFCNDGFQAAFLLFPGGAGVNPVARGSQIGVITAARTDGRDHGNAWCGGLVRRGQLARPAGRSGRVRRC